MKDTMSNVVGTLQIYRVENEVWTLLEEKTNLITYSGSDILGKALNGGLAVNCVYAVFENDPGAVRISPDRSNDATTYAASSPNRSFVRISTMGDPTYAASSTLYNSNKVVFLGVADSTSFFPAVPVTDGTSLFYHSALVAAPNMDDQTEDVVFSCADFSADITKVAGAQLGIRWTITFNTP